MPNWVFNSLVVSGDKIKLDEMREQLNKPVTKHYPERNYNSETQKWEDTPAVQHYSNPVFSFWNVIAPSNIEAYYGAAYQHDATNLIESIKEGFEKGEDWYNWNVRNWGSKWDIAVADDEKYAETTLEVTDDGELLYHFNTAWSPVAEVISALAQMYPELQFDYEYEEEQGWGGSMLFVNGVLTSETNYDIPDSHADFQKLDHRECNCETDPDSEYWFADCPVTDTHDWDEEQECWVEKESV